jgi:hypothetical protein
LLRTNRPAVSLVKIKSGIASISVRKIIRSSRKIIAERISQKVQAVTSRRGRLGITAFSDKPAKDCPWMQDEVSKLGRPGMRTWPPRSGGLLLP